MEWTLTKHLIGFYAEWAICYGKGLLVGSNVKRRARKRQGLLSERETWKVMSTLAQEDQPGIERLRVAIRRRVLASPDRRIEVTGRDLAIEAKLLKGQVHDAIWVLQRQGFLVKERTGARFRPMVLRLAEEPAMAESPPGPLEIACPRCGYHIDLAAAIEAKIKELEEARRTF